MSKRGFFKRSVLGLVLSVLIGGMAIPATARASGEITITKQPELTSYVTGETVKLSVEATGNKLKYQWYARTMDEEVQNVLDLPIIEVNNWEKIKSATKATLSLKMTKNSPYKGKFLVCVINDKGNLNTAHTLAVRPEWIEAAITNAEVTGDDVYNDGSGKKFKYAANDIRILYADATIPPGIKENTVKYKWYYQKESEEAKALPSGNKQSVRINMKKGPVYNGAKIWCEITTADHKESTDKVTAVYDEAKVTTVTTNPAGFSEFEFSNGTNVFEVTDVVTSNPGKLSYKWQWLEKGLNQYDETLWKDCTGGSRQTMKLKMTKADDGRKYRCVVSIADGGSKPSAAAQAKWVPTKIDDVSMEINGEPINTGIESVFKFNSVDTVTMKVTATSAIRKMTYQWYISKDGVTWAEIFGANKASVQMKMSKTAYGNKYIKCVIDNGESTWDTASQPGAARRVKAVYEEVPVNIISQTPEADFTYIPGDKVTFSVKADSKKKPLEYDWYYKKPDDTEYIPVPNGNKASISLTMTDEYANAEFWCRVSNGEEAPSTYSVKAVPEEVPVEIISQTPAADFLYIEGQTVTFSVKADSKKKPLHYEWYCQKLSDIEPYPVPKGNKASIKLKMTGEYAGAQFFCRIDNGIEARCSTTVTAVYESGYDSPAVRAEDTDLELATEFMNSMSVRLTRASSAADEIILPQEITEDDDAKILAMIATNAFKGYKGSVIEIPDTVTKIAKNAFAGTSGIETVKLTVKNPSKLTIAKNAFADLADGTTVEIIAGDRNQFKRVVNKIERSGAKNLVFKFVEAE